MVPGRDAPSPSVGPLLSADVQGWLETALRSDSDEDPEGELFDRELVRGGGGALGGGANEEDPICLD